MLFGKTQDGKDRMRMQGELIRGREMLIVVPDVSK